MSRIAEALGEGYSYAEITAFLSNDKRVSAAKAEGYSDEDIVNFLRSNESALDMKAKAEKDAPIVGGLLSQAEKKPSLIEGITGTEIKDSPRVVPTYTDTLKSTDAAAKAVPNAPITPTNTFADASRQTVTAQEIAKQGVKQDNAGKLRALESTRIDAPAEIDKPFLRGLGSATGDMIAGTVGAFGQVLDATGFGTPESVTKVYQNLKSRADSIRPEDVSKMGEMDQALYYMGSGLASSAGSILAIAQPELALPYLGFMGTTASGNKYQSLIEKGVSKPEAQANALITGTSEALTEMLGIKGGHRVMQYYAKLPLEARRQFTKRLLLGTGVMVMGAAEEGTEELINKQVENATDILTGAFMQQTERGNQKTAGKLASTRIAEGSGEAFKGGAYGGLLFGAGGAFVADQQAVKPNSGSEVFRDQLAQQIDGAQFTNDASTIASDRLAPGNAQYTQAPSVTNQSMGNELLDMERTAPRATVDDIMAEDATVDDAIAAARNMVDTATADLDVADVVASVTQPEEMLDGRTDVGGQDAAMAAQGDEGASVDVPGSGTDTQAGLLGGLAGGSGSAGSMATPAGVDSVAGDAGVQGLTADTAMWLGAEDVAGYLQDKTATEKESLLAEIRRRDASHADDIQSLLPAQTPDTAPAPKTDGSSEVVGANGMRIVHGSGNANLTADDIQIVRQGQKQGKKGRSYGGLYGASETDLAQAEEYAAMMGGTPTVYDITIQPGTRVLHKEGDITRLSENYINDLVAQGYGLVTGRDMRGRNEYVVIDRNAVAAMQPRSTTTNTTNPAGEPIAPQPTQPVTQESQTQSTQAASEGVDTAVVVTPAQQKVVDAVNASLVDEQAKLGDKAPPLQQLTVATPEQMTPAVQDALPLAQAFLEAAGYQHEMVVVAPTDDKTLDFDGAVASNGAGIVIAADSARTVPRVVVHEFGHEMRKEAPQVWETLAAEILGRTDKAAQLAHLKKRGYTGETLTPPMAEEFVNDVLSDMLNSGKEGPRILVDVASNMDKAEPGSGKEFLKRLLEFIDKVIKGMVGKGYGTEATILKGEVGAIRKAIAKALTDYNLQAKKAEKAKAAAEQQAEDRQSFSYTDAADLANAMYPKPYHSGMGVPTDPLWAERKAQVYIELARNGVQEKASQWFMRDFDGSVTPYSQVQVLVADALGIKRTGPWRKTLAQKAFDIALENGRKPGGNPKDKDIRMAILLGSRTGQVSSLTGEKHDMRRQAILKAITGKPVPKSKAGITAVETALVDHLGLKDMTKRDMDLAIEDFAMGRAAKAKQEAAFGPTGGVDYKGYLIYRIQVKSGDEMGERYVAESPENRARRERGERMVGGDALTETLDGAKKRVDFQVMEAEGIAKRAAEREAKDLEEKVKAEARKADDVRGFTEGMTPMQAEKVRITLGAAIRLNGVETTRRAMIDGLSENGTVPVETEEVNKIKDMTRTQFNRADNRQQRAHEEKVRAAGKKTVYYVNGFDLGKTAYDYAVFLNENSGVAKAKQEAAAAKKAALAAEVERAKAKPEKKRKTIDEFEAMLAAQRKEKKERLDAVGEFDVVAILRNTAGTQYQMVLPDASEPGKWRTQSFDDRGFSGHMVFASKQAALEDAVSSGYYLRDDEALDRLQDTPAFKRGNFSADLIRLINIGEIDMKEGNRRLAEYDKENGGKTKDAAPVEYRYAMFNRPAGLGTIPKEGFIRSEPRPEKGEAHYDYARNGIAVFNRKLTDDETKNFEMSPMLEQADMDELAAAVVSKMQKYADGYREMAVEEPEQFARTVSDKVNDVAGGYRPSIADMGAFVAQVKAGLAGDGANTEPTPASEAPTDDMVAVIEEQDDFEQDVADQLARFESGDFKLPGNVSYNMTGTDDEKQAAKEAAKAANETRTKVYVEAAKRFLEGDMTAKKPGKRDSMLDTDMVEGATPKGVPRNVKKVKTLDDTIKTLHSIAADGDVRYYLDGVHVEGDTLVATDGARAAAIADVDTTGLPAKPEKQEKGHSYTILNRHFGKKKGGQPGSEPTVQWIDGKFPDWQRVMPERHGELHYFDATQLGDYARGVAKTADYAYSYNNNRNAPLPITIGDTTRTYNAKYLADAADLFRSLGYDTIEVSYPGKAVVDGSIYLSSPDNKVRQVIMSMRGDPKTFAPIVAAKEASGPRGPKRKKSEVKRSLRNTITIDGKERPTTNSNGKPIAQTEEGLRNFWKWFGDSKVVDADGKPLVVYHGTDADFTVFKGKRGAHLGFHFGDKEAANTRLEDTADGKVDDAGVKAQNAVAEGYFNEWKAYEESLRRKDGEVPTDELMAALDAGEDIGPIFDKYKYQPTTEESAELLRLRVKWDRARMPIFKTAVGASIGAFYLQINKPLRMMDVGAWGVVKEVKAALPWDSDARSLGQIVEEIQSRGYDGIVYENRVETPVMRTDSYIAFSPTQIKSAIGNDGGFDGMNPDIRRSRRVPLQHYGVPKTWGNGGTVMTPMDSAVYTLQDRHIELKRAVQEIKATGAQLDDKWDPYLTEELFHGRAASRAQEFIKSELEPLTKDLLGAGISIAELDDYLWARHAINRNEEMEKINPEQVDANGDRNGSGLTDAEAQAKLDALTPAQQAQLESFALRVDDMNAETRRLMVEYGLETQDTIDLWEGKYPTYVPLMRDVEDEGGVGSGAGYSTGGKTSKRAMGSARAVENILANIANQRDKVINKGEKNRVAMAVYGAALLNPNPDFWGAVNPLKINDNTPANIAAIEKARLRQELTALGLPAASINNMVDRPTEKSIHPITGMVVRSVNPLYMMADNILSVRVNGEDRFVVFNPTSEKAVRAIAALKNLDVTDRTYADPVVERTMHVIGATTRYFAKVNTQYNPVFGAVNFTRDVQGALLNLQSTELKGQQKEVLKDVYRLMKDAAKHGFRMEKLDPADLVLWKQMLLEGGTTGYRDLFKDGKERNEAIVNALDPKNWQGTKWGKVLTANGYLASTEQLLLDKGNGIVKLLSDYNETMENVVRLAVFKAAIDHGLSGAKAASLSKNITTNFNRRGSIGQMAGQLFAFFNAAVQGTARIGETLIDRKPDGKYRISEAGKAIVIGGLIVGMLQPLLLALAGYGDDEPPEFVRDRNLIIPLWSKETGLGYATIPMPLGYHVIPAMTRIPMEAIMQGKAPKDVLWRMMGMFMEAFNPLGGSSSLTLMVSPTVTDPFFSLDLNKDWNGRPIYQESFSDLNESPGHTRAKDNSTGLGYGISYAINWLSGGDKYQAGEWSPTPDAVEYMIGQLTGGVGREVMKAWRSGKALAAGEAVPTHQIPLVSRFYGRSDGKSGEGPKFYTNLKYFNELRREKLERIAKKDDVSGFKMKNPDHVLIDAVMDARRDVNKLRKHKAELVEKGASRERIRLIDDKITGRMARINKKIEDRRDRMED